MNPYRSMLATNPKLTMNIPLPEFKSNSEIDAILNTMGPWGRWAAAYISHLEKCQETSFRQAMSNGAEAQMLKARNEQLLRTPYTRDWLSAGCGHVLQYDINTDQFSFKPIDRLILDQLHALNTKVDLAMSQQHTDALAIMTKLKADVGTLLAAISNSSNPPTPEDWSDVVTAATEIDSSILTATPPPNTTA